MADTPDIREELVDKATHAQAVTTPAGSATQRPLPDLIEADKHLRRTGQPPTFAGIRILRFRVGHR